MSLGLLIFIGLPGSGKTTLIHNLKNNFKHYTDDQYYFIHLCYDELIPFTKGRSQTEWKKLRNTLALDIEKLVKAIKCKSKEMSPPIFSKEMLELNSFDQKIVLIIDDNMYFKSMRYTLYQISKKNCIGFCQVFVNCSLDLVLLKNAQRQAVSKVPSEVIRKMAEKIEPPNLQNNWEKFSLTVTAFCDVKDFCSQLFPLLNISLVDSENSILCEKSGSNIKEKHKGLTDSRINILHQADLALRQILKFKMQESLSQTNISEPQALFLQLNKRRSDILHDLKKKNISLPDEISQDILNQENKNKLYKLLNAYF